MTPEPLAVSFVTIASTLFVAELTDKDAILLLTLATKVRATRVFAAGSIAFVLTTTVNVLLGAVLSVYVDLVLVKLAGGIVMLGYGVWEIRGVFGARAIAEEEKRIKTAGTGLRPFFLMVGALALLDLAGDATMVLTIVFMAHYLDYLLVFTASCLGLILAVAVETALGNRIGGLLTPLRLRYLSVVVFISLGVFIIFSAV